MKNKISLLLFGALFFSYAKSYACNGAPGSVERIVCLADSLKSTLTTSQIATLQLTYSYDNARNWSNLPVGNQPRLGIKLGSLTAAQLAIAKAIVQEISGTTANEGYAEALQLFYADAYLGANGGGNGYGEGLYYLCFNGTPSLTGLFSIKLGGHHLQIENTYNNGVMVGGTPHFEAVEPLSFTWNGTTYNPVSEEKNALAAMFATLSSSELATAKLSNTFTDVLMGAKNNGSYKDWIFPATKVGLKVGDLSTSQKNLVLEAIKTYVLDVDDIDANAIISQYTQELDETYIAWSGNSSLTVKNDYARIDGPGVWIEFTVQGGIVFSGVHYHSIWRDHTRDYGGQGGPDGLATTQVGGGVSAVNDYASIFSDISIWPNPAESLSTLTLTASRTAPITIQLFDVSGKKVRDVFVGNAVQGKQTFSVDLARLNRGCYFLTLWTDNRKRAFKIVKI